MPHKKYWRRQWQSTPVLLPGKFHGQRSLVGCSPWGHEESDMTEWLHFHFSLSCIGEGNGSPLQCSCLENPRDGGAWWAAVYGVAQSWTRLKRLSSSSMKNIYASWSRKWPPTPVFLPGKVHGWKSLVSCSPWGHMRSHDWAHMHEGVRGRWVSSNNQFSKCVYSNHKRIFEMHCAQGQENGEP